MDDPILPAAVPAPTDVPAPSRPGPKQLARACGCSVGELAQRTLVAGRPVNRRTLYRWHDAGAPFTSEADLRRWLANNGAVVAPIEPSISERIDAMMPVAQSAPSTPAGQRTGATLNPDGTERTTKQLADLAAVDARRVRAERDQIEIDARKRVLIHRDHVVSLVKALALDVVTGLVDLPPQVVRRIGDLMPADHRPTVRQAIDAEVLALRAKLTASVPERLARLFDEDQGDAP
jgi:hypothetical protein